MSNHLIYVLTKIAFACIPDKEFRDATSKIHSALRKRYPGYVPNAETRMAEITLTPNGQEVKESVVPLMIFTSAEKDWGIRISPDSLFFHTKKYVNFDDFKERLSFIINVVHKELDITHTGFVGVRYINKIKADPDGLFTTTIKRNDFIQPILDDLQLGGSNLMANYKNEAGWIRLNSGVMVNGVNYPEDIMDLAIDLGVIRETKEGVYAHFDVDSFCPSDNFEDYNFDSLMKKISDLRSNVKKIFEEVVN